MLLQVYLSYVYPIRLIRKELGHKDNKLLNSDLVNIFVTDVEKYEDEIDGEHFKKRTKLILEEFEIE